MPKVTQLLIWEQNPYIPEAKIYILGCFASQTLLAVPPEVLCGSAKQQTKKEQKWIYLASVTHTKLFWEARPQRGRRTGWEPA